MDDMTAVTAMPNNGIYTCKFSDTANYCDIDGSTALNPTAFTYFRKSLFFHTYIMKYVILFVINVVTLG